MHTVGRDRVWVRLGQQPIIFVCPHGADDCNTIDVTFQCAENLDAYAIINEGFERAEIVDVLKNQADCNRVDHVLEDVVREEFLNPLLKAVSLCQFKTTGNVLILHIHGFGNQVERNLGQPAGVILGYGRGLTDSLTCPLWRVHHFVDAYRYQFGQWDIWAGKPGGKYSARSKNNLAQYFRKHLPVSDIHSLQIEIAQKLRKDAATVNQTVANLTAIIEEQINLVEYYEEPTIPEL